MDASQVLLADLELPTDLLEDAARARELWAGRHRRLHTVLSTAFDAAAGSFRVALDCSCTMVVAVEQAQATAAANVECMPTLEKTSCRVVDREGVLVLLFFSDSWSLSVSGQPALECEPLCNGDT